MSPGRLRQLLLALLLLVLIGVGVRGLRELASGGVGGAARSAAPARAERQSGASIGEVVDLRLEDLAIRAGRYSPGRDPFRFGQRPRPAPPPPVPREEEEAPHEALEQAVAPPAPTGPQPPPVDVVYLGSFGPRHRPLAVFSDGSDIYNALQGDVLKEKFIVEQVGYESVDLGFVGFPDAPPQRLAVGG